MKNFIKNTLVTGIPFGIIFGILYGLLLGSMTYGIAVGSTSGMLFGVAMSILSLKLTNKFQKLSDTSQSNGQAILMEGGANHFKGVEAVGGWLQLTSDEIIFKSHGMNVQKHETVIPLKHIQKIEKVNTLGLIPNGLKIVTHDQKSERFVVNNRKQWVEKLPNTM